MQRKEESSASELLSHVEIAVALRQQERENFNASEASPAVPPPGPSGLNKKWPSPQKATAILIYYQLAKADN